MKANSDNLVKGAKRQQLVRSIRRSARTNDHHVYVLPKTGEWGIKLEGEDKLVRKFSSKSLAIKNAKELAAQKNSILVILDHDGRILSMISYAG